MGCGQQSLIGSVTGGYVVPPDPSGPSPLDLSDLQFWVKANNTQFNGASDADQVSTWNESSGNARNCTGVLRTNFKPRFYKTVGPNSYPAISLIDASGDGGHFTVPNFLQPAGYTAGDVFEVVNLVFDPPNVSDAAAPVCGDWGTAGDSYFPFTNSQVYDDFGSNTRKDAIVTGVSLAAWRVIEKQTAALWEYLIDGVSKRGPVASTVAWGTAPFLGRTATNAKYLRGWIAEIIFYSRVLTSSERFDTIHTYLNNKYAFSLPTS